MEGKLRFDLRRNHGLAGIIAFASTIGVLAAPGLAVPVFAQTAPAAAATFADSAEPITPSETSLPADGAEIVAPDKGYALSPPDNGPLTDPSRSTITGDAGEDSSSAADAALAAPPAANETADDADGASLIDAATPMPLATIAPIAAADWDRVGDSEGDDASGDGGNPVLEVPRALPSPDASSGDGGNQSAQGGDSSPADEVGSVDEYQDEQDYPTGVYITPANGPPVLNPPFAAGTFANQAPAMVPAQPGNGAMLPFGVGGMRPFARGMNSAIMPTSPMYPRGVPMTRRYSPMVPRGAAPLPGRWWNRAR